MLQLSPSHTVDLHGIGTGEVTTSMFL
jgi:hypothetical protein